MYLCLQSYIDSKDDFRSRSKRQLPTIILDDHTTDTPIYTSAIHQGLPMIINYICEIYWLESYIN